MVYVLGEIGIFALGIAAHKLQEGEAGNSFDNEEVQKTVIQLGIGNGVEAAAVEASVAGADKSHLAVIELTVADNAEGTGDALEEVGGKTCDIAGGTADQGNFAVFMDIGGNAGVYTNRADINAVSSVAVDKVDGADFAVDESLKLEEKLSLVTEGFDKVIAGTGGEVGDCHMVPARSAADAFVEGTVASAGINPKAIAEIGLVLYLFYGVHGCLGGVYFKVALLAGEKLGDFRGDKIGAVLAAGGGIYYKQVLHKFTSQICFLFLFMNLQVHEQITFYHAVVELSFFVGGFAEGALKLRMGGEEIELPVFRGEICLAEAGIESLRLTALHNTLAVGRICDDDASLGLAAEAHGIGNFKLNNIGNACAKGVFLCYLYGVGVYIGSKDAVIAAELLCSGLITDSCPHKGVKTGPVHGSEVSFKAGGTVFGNQSRLNGYGAAAAEGVGEIFPASVAGKAYHCGGHSFLQRCGVMGGTVAALVETEAGGVDAKAGSVLHNGKLHLIERAGFIKPFDAVDLFKALHDCLFDYLLAVGNGEKLGVEAVALYGEGAVFGNEHLPGESLGALKKLVKAEGIKTAYFDEHALAYTKVYIGSGYVLLVAGEENAAVFRGNISHLHSAQLVGNGTFKTQKTGHAKFVIHSFFSVSLFNFNIILHKSAVCKARGMLRKCKDMKNA